MSSACEKFRDFLEQTIKGSYAPGHDEENNAFKEMLQIFDELHQACQENTGEKCKVNTVEYYWICSECAADLGKHPSTCKECGNANNSFSRKYQRKR